MSNDVAKPAARISPNDIAIVMMWLRFMREDAERAGDQATEQAAYSVAWFCATGRAFTGLQRAMGHMTKGTLRAFVARVAKGMQAEGKVKRGPGAGAVTGDLTNAVLAAAFGCADVRTAEELCCNHPYGARLTIG
jgi:hypothetical protein